MEDIKSARKFLLVSIIPQKVTEEDALRDLRELKSLVESYGGVVVDLVTQSREIHDKGMYIGTGKVQEVTGIIKQKHIDVVVLNAIVNPGQLYDMKSIFYNSNPGIEVWDRVDLILHIFSKHAKTSEARLQIELAAMHHMGPRVYGMGMVLSRQTGGIGGRGIGETNTELMKRHWRDQIKKTQDKLVKLSSDRRHQLERRQKIGLQTVSIIGYTNAGKTSLFNYLSGKKKLSHDILFATLDSAVGKVYFPDIQKEVLLSDTIGFIKNLPAKLVEAFKSTLMESIHADLLLHVIDASDADMEKKIVVVEQVLWDLHIASKKKLYVFNKMDMANGFDQHKVQEKFGLFHPQFVSTKTGDGIESLRQIIQQTLQFDSS